MSRAIVKKALEMLDEDDKDIDQSRRTKQQTKKNKKKKKNPIGLTKDKSRKEVLQTCLTLQQLSKPVVSTDQIEQLTNYRFGGPSKRDLQLKKKKEKEETVFTEEDFERFAREYNPPLQKS